MADPLSEHYQERNDSELAMELDRGHSVMVHRLRLHRTFLPDVVFAQARRSYATHKFNALLEVLGQVRAACPRRFFYIYVEGTGRGSEWDEIYLMGSSNGVDFAPVTYEEGVQDFCSECEMLIEEHNRAPADDPGAQHKAGRPGAGPWQDRGA